MNDLSLNEQLESELRSEIEQLRQQVSDLEAERVDLETLLETITEHSDLVEDELGKKNELIRYVFGRYLTKEVVATLLDSPTGLTFGGERKKITILTSDLRGFTSLSEQLSAEEVINIINFYLRKMTDIITEYDGTIDEFMGDGILVFFGAPNSREDDANRAIACAIAMQLAMKSVNQQMTEWNLPPLEMGIGINTGEVVVGNIGSEKRAKYGVVGSQVNLTYRIESYTVGGQILISESTFEEVDTVISVKTKKQVQPKGVAEPISIYEIEGIGEPYNLFLPDTSEQFVTLPNPIHVEYVLLEGKHLGENIFEGMIIEISERGAKIYSNRRRKDDLPADFANIKLNLVEEYNTNIEAKLPPELSNLKLKFAHKNEDGNTNELYSKVIVSDPEHKCFQVRFTTSHNPLVQTLRELYQQLV